MSKVLQGLRYTKEHEWVKIESDAEAHTELIMGISDYAQESFTDLVYIEFPEIGTIVNQGDELGVIESVKASSEYYSPVSGEVIEVNSSLEDSPEIVNQDPYGEGWLVKLKVGDKNILETDLNNLMDPDTYSKFMEEQAHH